MYKNHMLHPIVVEIRLWCSNYRYVAENLWHWCGCCVWFPFTPQLRFVADALQAVTAILRPYQVMQSVISNHDLDSDLGTRSRRKCKGQFKTTKSHSKLHPIKGENIWNPKILVIDKENVTSITCIWMHIIRTLRSRQSSRTDKPTPTPLRIITTYTLSYSIIPKILRSDQIITLSVILINSNNLWSIIILILHVFQTHS